MEQTSVNKLYQTSRVCKNRKTDTHTHGEDEIDRHRDRRTHRHTSCWTKVSCCITINPGFMIVFRRKIAWHVDKERTTYISYHSLYLRKGGRYAIRSVGPSPCLCAASRKQLWIDLHEIFISWPSLDLVSLWRPSRLTFSGHSRTARSLRHKIDCSAEMVRLRVTAKVTWEN